MRRLTSQALIRRISRNDGVTLIELVIGLVIIGISVATIASLLITALNFSENNQSYAERLRAAESCYETLLAVEEAGRWASGQPKNGCSPGGTAVTGARLDNWTQGNTYNQLFTASGTQTICVTQRPTCDEVTIGGKPATKFTIPIQDKNNLQLIVP